MINLRLEMLREKLHQYNFNFKEKNSKNPKTAVLTSKNL